ncbi:GDP-mannose 4,6-dehydratase [Alkalihalobacillus berkeleyi]|uniref:GDP-mannose 4,6-dehydratase n=1 Tax=Pseudalkalibacillus berkeleyi TaxID=1069813 RepID=A0ABS9H2T8_9BACL|nr:GDP-mannose 4,6-dehydratase [Pseudalkalibacillus berkeleyi]
MKIAVTGGAGFIGGHLCKRLISEMHDVTIIDNLDPYYSIKQKQLHMKDLERYGRFTFIQEDLRDEEKTAVLFQTHQFDSVIHLAALPGVTYSVEQPIPYVDYDIKATINVLKASGESGVNHVLFASSSSVYGNKEGAFSEEMRVGEVESPYAAAKAGAESFCHAFQRLYGFQVTILRLFTVYGPWGRPDMAIPKFTHRLLSGQPIEVYSLNSARDYTYVEDCVDGIHAAIHAKHAYETFNIGSGNPITMNELLRIFRSHFPKMNVIEKPWRTGDVNQTWSDITKARTILNYAPTMSIQEGIDRTVQWAKTWDI